MVQNWLTRLLLFFPVLSGVTALSSPAGISVYWLSNSIFTLAQTVFVKNELASVGLDMRQMARDNIEAQKDPMANAVKLMEAEKAVSKGKEDKARNKKILEKIEQKSGFGSKEDILKKAGVSEAAVKAIDKEKKAESGEEEAKLGPVDSFK